MADPDGPGLGIVVRMVLDGLDEIGADLNHTEEARRNVLESAGQLGIVIPKELADPEATAIYRSLIGEMTLAKSATGATYGTVGLHVKRTDDEHLGFHTKLEPGHFTDMVATACVLAQLDLLKRAANLFGWGGYPFHCPWGATPLLLVVNGRRRHNGWGSGTASWCLGAVKWIPPFGWTVDAEKLAELISEAQQLNDYSAAPSPPRSHSDGRPERNSSP
jgi:hypothetical protein